MKGFLQEYGIIMVVVAVVLGMLAFGKTGYAKGIQDAILGSTDHIVETGENIVPKTVKASDIIEIEGTKYIVLEKRENNQALVMTADSIGRRGIQAYSSDDLRPDGQYKNTYEGSEIDNYLENDWYNSLSSAIKTAIQSTNIKQTSYDSYLNKQETGYHGQVYNTISRHAFLPSIEEIGKVVDLNDKNKVKEFTNNTNIWTRDSPKYDNDSMWYLDAFFENLRFRYVHFTHDVHPAFVIDLSKVDYTEVGHVDYK